MPHQITVFFTVSFFLQSKGVTSKCFCSRVGIAHFSLLKGLSEEPLGQRLRAELGHLMGAWVDLSWQDQSVQPVWRWQRFKQFVDVFFWEWIFASCNTGGVVLVPLLEEPGLVLALFDSKVLRLVEFHRFLKSEMSTIKIRLRMCKLILRQMVADKWHA